MKIKPVILCGGAGTRLWPKSKNNLAKQFINFGGWTLLDRTLQRIKDPIFDSPIISTNMSYLTQVRKHLLKNKIYKYKIILEPYKKNTAPAILSCALIEEVSFSQPMIFFPADHLIDKMKQFNKKINLSQRYLEDDNISIFGIKPKFPSSQYGYFLTKKISKNINKVTKFIEKPNLNIAKKIIKNKGLWNSGIIFARKIAILNNFREYQKKIFDQCIESVFNSKVSNNVCLLSKAPFKKIESKSFDYAILEKSKKINGIKIDIDWSDLGSWKEISTIFYKNKFKYFYKKNVFFRPWGKYTNLFIGKGFLIKEIIINPKSSISLQKHNHRSEHWTIFSGKAKITLNKKKFIKKAQDTIFVARGSIHRIENPFNKPVTIMEAQTGPILKEEDIIRYKDIYGRIK
tara:strand:- start:282 stop:1487 length:1206 start_codon:yes stop_codon:yes gene_type:complete